MKARDLVVGDAYLIRAGKYGDGYRCVVLDAEPAYKNVGTDWLSSYAAETLRFKVVRFPFGAPRPLVAVEITWRRTRDEEQRHRWVPFAATLASIRHPWAEEEHLRAKREEDLAASRVRSDERARLAEIENERRRAESAERDRGRKIEEARQAEFYETRLQPLLVDAGLVDGEYRFDSRNLHSPLTIDPEALARILADRER